MFLLFFLLIALGLLTALWIIFPAAGIRPPDPLPPRPQAVVQTAPDAPPAVANPPAGAGSATEVSTTPGVDPAPGSSTPEAGAPVGMPAAATASTPPASPGDAGTAPAPVVIDIEDLRRALEQLLNPPPSK